MAKNANNINIEEVVNNLRKEISASQDMLLEEIQNLNATYAYDEPGKIDCLKISDSKIIYKKLQSLEAKLNDISGHFEGKENGEGKQSPSPANSSLENKLDKINIAIVANDEKIDSLVSKSNKLLDEIKRLSRKPSHPDYPAHMSHPPYKVEPVEHLDEVLSNSVDYLEESLSETIKTISSVGINLNEQFENNKADVAKIIKESLSDANKPNYPLLTDGINGLLKKTVSFEKEIKLIGIITIINSLLLLIIYFK